MHFRIHGKRDKIRFVPVHAAAERLIEECLFRRHGEDGAGLSSVRSRTTARRKSWIGRSIPYRNIVRHYGLAAGISGEVSGLCVHSLGLPRLRTRYVTRPTYRQRPGMARPRQRSSTRLYDRRKNRPEDSPNI
jgi:integrase/recombinase XerD